MGAAMSKLHIERFNELFEPNQNGRVFITPSMEQFDLSGIRILYNSTDTVRQLYQLHLCSVFLESLDLKMAEEGFHTRIFKLNGFEFALKRGGESGYKYLLQNSELGLILLIKHQKTKSECSGPHLKIEVSPKLISEHSPETLQLLMDNVADLIAFDGNYQPKACAVHIALDFQGWEPPVGFESGLSCRSRRVTSRSGIDQLYFDTDICAVHGRGQSYLFGSANGLQVAVYNKTLESKASDKQDYMNDCWSRKSLDYDTPLYDPALPVWRVEVRFHHSVIKQFSDMNVHAPVDTVKDGVKKYGSMNVNRLTTYESIVPHFGGLWRYALNNFRYDLNTKFIHPLWSLLMSESGFDDMQNDFVYRRKYKTAGVGNEKNVAIALGNMLSIFARNKLTTDKALDFIKTSGIYGDVVSYFRSRGLSKADIRLFIEDGLIKRRLSSKLAA
jgi:hypothetical protein